MLSWAGLERRSTHRERERNHAEEIRGLRDRLAAATAALEQIGPADRALVDALRAKAKVVIDRGDEGHEEVARLLRALDAAAAEAALADQVAQQLGDLSLQAFDIRNQWLALRRGTGAEYVVSRRDSPDLFARVEQAQSEVWDDLGTIIDNLTELGLPSTIVWVPPARPERLSMPGWFPQALHDLAADANAEEVDAAQSAASYEELRSQLQQAVHLVAERQARVAERASTSEAELETILNRPF